MQFGLHIADFTFDSGPAQLGPTLARHVKHAEDAGIQRITVMDHFWQLPGIGPVEHEMLEAYATLGFLAAHTRKAMLHVLVTGVIYRHPALLAKQVSTLNVLSGGRVGLGIGAGWNEQECVGLGFPFSPVAQRFRELEETIQRLDGYTAEARAATILEGLGLPTEVHRAPLSTLSGGFKLRVLLAQVLASRPDLLLLDEPTNHLDIPSKEMLEEALQSFEGTVIAISHDRYFLRQIATRVLNFDNGVVSDYMGDYSYFLEKNEKAGARDARLQKAAKEVEKTQVKAKSKMSKAEKAKLKKEKAKAFGGGSGKKKANKNAGRWN